MNVRISIKPEDLPGRPLKRVKCEGCGEYVQDMREVHKSGKVLCMPCAEGGYYTIEDKPDGNNKVSAESLKKGLTGRQGFLL